MYKYKECIITLFDLLLVIYQQCSVYCFLSIVLPMESKRLQSVNCNKLMKRTEKRYDITLISVIITTTIHI